MMKLINAFRFRCACKKVSALHDELLDEQRWARTDERLSGSVNAWRAAKIEQIENAKQTIANAWNADIEAMRLAGL